MVKSNKQQRQIDAFIYLIRSRITYKLSNYVVSPSSSRSLCLQLFFSDLLFALHEKNEEEISLIAPF